MNALTVLLCCNSSFGVVNFRGGLIRALVEQGHRVVVVAPKDEYSGKFANLGAEFIPWDLTGRGTSLLTEINAVRQLTRIYRNVRPDAAFHYTIKAVIYGAIASRRTGTPCLSIITGLGYVFLNRSIVSKISRALYRRTLRWSREIWFLNADDQEHFEQLALMPPQISGQLLPGEGIDTEHFGPAPAVGANAGSLTFLMVARLLRDKGVFEFVEAATLVKQRYPSARFQILGAANADNPSAIGSGQVGQWVKEGIIEYLGTAQDVRPAVANADCVVLPSYREGVPRCLLEAASMERPLITTDVPGCREVVRDGATGLLCKVKDASDLAAKMLAVAGLPQTELRNMGRAGRRFMLEQFDERIVITRYLDALDRIARPRPSTAQ